MSDRARSLSELLGGELPPGIAALDAERQQVIADALRAARRKQSASLATAGEGALKYVPALLRGAVRKAVGL